MFIFMSLFFYEFPITSCCDVRKGMAANLKEIIERLTMAAADATYAVYDTATVQWEKADVISENDQLEFY